MKKKQKTPHKTLVSRRHFVLRKTLPPPPPRQTEKTKIKIATAGPDNGAGGGKEKKFHTLTRHLISRPSFTPSAYPAPHYSRRLCVPPGSLSRRFLLLLLRRGAGKPRCGEPSYSRPPLTTTTTTTSPSSSSFLPSVLPAPSRQRRSRQPGFYLAPRVCALKEARSAPGGRRMKPRPASPPSRRAGLLPRRLPRTLRGAGAPSRARRAPPKALLSVCLSPLKKEKLGADAPPASEGRDERSLRRAPRRPRLLH